MVAIRIKSEYRLRISLVKIGIFFLLLYSFTVPLANYFYPSVIIKYLTLIAAAGLFCIAMLKNLSTLNVRITPTEIVMFFLGFFVTIGNYELQIGGYYFVVSYWVMWVVAVASKYDGRWLTTVLNLTCIFSMVYALATVIAYLSESIYMTYMLPLFKGSNQAQMINFYRDGYMLGLTSHYSTNGMYLAVGVGAFFAKLMENLKSKLNWCCLLIMMLALLLTGKRGPLLFAVGAMVVVFYLYKSDKPKGRLLKIFCLGAAALVAVLVASIWMPSILNSLNRFISSSESGDVTAGRGPLFALAISLFKQKPLFGWGWGSYQYLYYQYLGKNQYVFQYRHAHNIYLQLLCEVGIIGFTAFCIFFVWQLYRVLKLYRDYRKGKILLPSSARSVLPFAVYSQLFFLMYGMTGNPLYDVIVLFPYLLSCIIVNYYSSAYFSRSRCLMEYFRSLFSKRK
ncbi:MAG: O-antigen ligase family protein [Ruminococcus sp.]